MSLDVDPGTQLVVDPRDAAESVGLRYVSDDEPGLRRRKIGKGFSYLKPDGKSGATKPRASVFVSSRFHLPIATSGSARARTVTSRQRAVTLKG